VSINRPLYNVNGSGFSLVRNLHTNSLEFIRQHERLNPHCEGTDVTLSKHNGDCN
jgi:hypothetical protein